MNNHNPILQPRWLVHVKIHLLRTVKHCETFIRTGAITTPSGKTIVSFRQHGFDIADGNLPPHSWDDPSKVMYTKLPATVAAVATRVLPDNYMISPLHLLEFDSEIVSAILSACTNVARADKMKTDANGSGREILRSEFKASMSWLTICNLEPSEVSLSSLFAVPPVESRQVDSGSVRMLSASSDTIATETNASSLVNRAEREVLSMIQRHT